MPAAQNDVMDGGEEITKNKPTFDEPVPIEAIIGHRAASVEKGKVRKSSKRVSILGSTEFESERVVQLGCAATINGPHGTMIPTTEPLMIMRSM